MPIQFMRKLIFQVSSCGHKQYGVIFFFLVSYFGTAHSSENIKPQIPLQELTAKYQIKASFFPLPVDAEIIVAQLEPHVYEARIQLDSRFLKVKQSERARIQNCEVQLLAIESTGSRSNADDWNERVEVFWPEQRVNYHYDNDQQVSYRAEYSPTGFATLFAHQFVSMQKGDSEKTLLYTQSKKGVIFSYRLMSRSDEIKSKLTRKKIQAQHFAVLRGGSKDEHPPGIWYVVEEQGAFPVKLAIKIGVFTIEANLKEISSSTLEQTDAKAFFALWGCGSSDIKGFGQNDT
jgi:hypothetical protein